MLRKFDWILMIAPIILTIIGLLSIYSTIGKSTTISQAAYLAISIAIVFIVSRFDMKFIINYGYIIFMSMLLVTLLTLPFGVTRNGATAWFELGSYTFQPSEILKITFILAITRYYASQTYHRFKHVFKSAIYFLLPVLIVLVLQKDLGTAIVFIFMWLGIQTVVYFSQHEKNKILIFFIIVGMISAFSASYFLEGYKLDRLEVYPDHLFLTMDHHSGIGYQVDQSLIAIGSTSFLGKGLGRGTQTQFGFLPEKHNDFIFASILEEMGLSAGLIILMLYGLIGYRLFVITKYSNHITIDIIIAGILSLIIYHVLQNIGMNIGIVPVTGISLPFVSYGGSFMVTSYTLIGISESIYLRNKNTLS